MSRGFVTTLAVLAVVVVVVCGGGAWVIEAAAHLVLGWARNLRDVLPRVAVNGAGVALFVVALVPAAWLGHSACRWLWQNGRTTGEDDERPWRWKWTLIGMAGVLLMFVSGVAVTGVVHQTGWLLNSPVPLLETRRRPAMLRIKCASNLRQIGLAVSIYIKDGGHWPASRGEVARLMPTLDLLPDPFVCPASSHDKAPGTQPTEWAAALDDERHFSYVVCPHPLPPPHGSVRVVMYEPIDLHDDGLHVLYEDGSVDWLDRPEAERWLKLVHGAGVVPSPGSPGEG